MRAPQGSTQGRGRRAWGARVGVGATPLPHASRSLALGRPGAGHGCMRLGDGGRRPCSGKGGHLTARRHRRGAGQGSEGGTSKAEGATVTEGGHSRRCEQDKTRSGVRSLRRPGQGGRPLAAGTEGARAAMVCKSGGYAGPFKSRSHIEKLEGACRHCAKGMLGGACMRMRGGLRMRMWGRGL
jgi:hypothetical protein